jgi:4-hydroxybenzoate polyprenyltransferase
MSLGVVVVFLILAFLILETGAKVLANPHYHFEVVGNKDENKRTKDMAREYHDRTLTLAGFVFAGISIIVSVAEDLSEFTNPLLLFALSLSLLMVSYQAKILTQTRRVWFTIQDKTLSYGFISLFIGVIFVYSEYSDSSVYLLVSALLLIAVMRVIEARSEIGSQRKRWNKSDEVEESRVGYLCSLLVDALS